ncbi:hypothetical protein Droror1_Dr00005647 [Drosera rotundifolia]
MHFMIASPPSNSLPCRKVPGIKTSELSYRNNMTDQENGQHVEEPTVWSESELKLPELLFDDGVRRLHEAIEKEWDTLQQSACQMAAGRALWKHVTRDPLAEVLAGETYLRNFHEKIRKDCLNKAPQVSGVILAVRTLWFDAQLKAALESFQGKGAQVVLLGAGMDMRAFRLGYLKNSDIFEEKTMTAKSLTRVAADLRDEDWPGKLQSLGFEPERNTVWILEDFMNKATKLSSSTYSFYSDWPDQLLPSLGFSDVRLSQIGDPDAHFGLLQNPSNLFNKLRSIPRSVETNPDDGTPCCRLYLVKASKFPNPNKISP